MELLHVLAIATGLAGLGAVMLFYARARSRGNISRKLRSEEPTDELRTSGQWAKDESSGSQGLQEMGPEQALGEAPEEMMGEPAPASAKEKQDAQTDGNGDPDKLSKTLVLPVSEPEQVADKGLESSASVEELGGKPALASAEEKQETQTDSDSDDLPEALVQPGGEPEQKAAKESGSSTNAGELAGKPAPASAEEKQETQTDGDSDDLPEALVQLGGEPEQNAAKEPGSSTSAEEMAQSHDKIPEADSERVSEVQETSDPTGDNLEEMPEQSSTARYVPSIRTSETTAPRNRVAIEQPKRPRSQEKSLTVSVRAVFGRRNSVHVSLLPVRSDGLGEEVQVQGPTGSTFWFACQDEWYGDFVPPAIGEALATGMRWHGSGGRWVLTPRDIYVLAPSSTISGYVSATRLLLNEDQIVLCCETQQDAVSSALQQAGCAEFECEKTRGVPEGWILFNNVHPKIPVEHDTAVGILNVLRPLHEVDVLLQGGIRLSHNKWLNGHPPNIRVRGADNSDSETKVTIDGEEATIEADGGYATPRAFDPGRHVVFCGGVTQAYELVDGLESWQSFEAFSYGIDRELTTAIAVCGPMVLCDGHRYLARETNRCLIGSKPGEISIGMQPYGLKVARFLAITKFPVVWALPDNPYRCNKSRVFAKLGSDANAVRPSGDYDAGGVLRISRWCNAILNASRKRLRTDPDTVEARTLWLEYVRVARQIKRRRR